jgi:hypothetical protein
MKEKLDNQKETILKLLAKKSVMKQNVYANTIKVFDQMRNVSKHITDDFAKSFQLKVAGDMLQFDMHTNVFEFERSHPIYKSSYVKQNDLNSYCGIISVYNFLSDSFKFNRLNDVGFLIARIFVNRENRFFIETKTSLNNRYGNYSEEGITDDNIKDIIQELMIFAVSFDLFIPPYDAVKQVSVMEIQEKASSAVLKTGKRLGYIGHDGDDSSFNDDINL